MTQAKKTAKPVQEAVVVEPVEAKSEKPRSFNVGSIFWGFTFVGLGSLLLLDNLGVLSVNLGNLWQLWPALIIGAGISMLSLRGWLATVVSFVLVISLGLLVWLVAVDNPYYNSETSFDSQQVVTALGGDVAADATNGLDVTLKTGAINLVLNSSSTENGYVAELNSNRLTLNQSESVVRDGIQYVTVATEATSNWMMMGSMNNRLSFDVTEQVPLRMHIDTGASSVSGDLSGAQLQSLTLKAGASSVDLRFGDRVAKQDITLEAGASSVTLTVPKSVGVRVETDNGLSHTDFEGVDKQSDGVYESSGFATAEKQITIHAKVGVSSFELRRY